MESNTTITIPQMLQKLDNIYKEQDEIIIQAKQLQLKWEQLESDAKLLMDIIKHQQEKNLRDYSSI